MSTVHFEPLCPTECPKGRKFEVRGYDCEVDGRRSLDSLPEWVFCCVVSVEGARAHVSLAHGEFRRAYYRDIVGRLRSMGVESVYWERHLRDGTIRPVEVEL